MRRYIFNGSIVGALFSGVGAIRATAAGPRDWRLILIWVSWGLAVAIAIGTVVKETEASRELED